MKVRRNDHGTESMNSPHDRNDGGYPGNDGIAAPNK